MNLARHAATPILTALWLAAAIVLPRNEASAAECGGRPCITIGTYNIKLLGGDKAPANTLAEITRLADRVGGAGFDVIVLTEITVADRDWWQRLLPALEARGLTLTGAGEFGGSDPGRQQHVVLLHSPATVSVIAAAEDLPTPTGYDNGAGCAHDSVRPAITARYRVLGTGFDFRLYGVHMKSNRPVNGDGACDDEIWTFQAGELAGAIARFEAAEGERNHIVTGDFNMPFETPETAPLRALGYRSLIDAPCSKAQIWNCSYVVHRWAGIIDHVVIGAATAEAVEGSGTIVAVGDLKDYLKTQSDHVPVYARFYVDLPDDD